MIISHKYWLINCNYGQLKKISIVTNHPVIMTNYQNYVLYSVSLNSPIYAVSKKVSFNGLYYVESNSFLSDYIINYSNQPQIAN